MFFVRYIHGKHSTDSEAVVKNKSSSSGSAHLLLGHRDTYTCLRDAIREESSVLDTMEQELVSDEKGFMGENVFVTSMSSGETEDIIQLDVVGGEPICVLRSTLRQCQDSVLYCQYDVATWRQHDGKDNDDSDAGVLVNQPAYAFGKIIDQLRLRALTPHGAVVPCVYVAPHEVNNFQTVVQYYFPGQEYFVDFELDMFPSSVILVSRVYKLLLLGWIQETLTSHTTDRKLSLLYQATRDGFSAANFHAKCDKKGATVTLVKTTEGYVFGGYTDQSWQNKKSWTYLNLNKFVSSSRAFLFSFVNPSGHSPIKLPLTDPGHHEVAIYCDHKKGPTFGGTDLILRGDRTRNGFCRLGNAYTLPPGQQAETFLTEASSFTVSEIEVFKWQKL